ncbi:MAG: hypothetical protein Q4D51_06505 [Eubacteriales bacterium]|nr:hypothetical protein [Eubacteriales bacterium]
MDKIIVNMTNWEIMVRDGKYNLSGTADFHPILGKYAYVAHTSPLIAYQFLDGILTYETQNTIYICPLKYMEVNPYKNVEVEYKQELARQADESDDILDRLVATLAKISIGDVEEDEFVKQIQLLCEVGQEEIQETMQEDDDRLCEIVAAYENAVYMEVSNTIAGDKLAYHIGEYCGVKYPKLHAESVQDGIIYTKSACEGDDSCEFDFRYLSDGSTQMETCGWSENIKQVIIKNMKREPIVFNHEMIAPKELKIFTIMTISERVFF